MKNSQRSPAAIFADSALAERVAVQVRLGNWERARAIIDEGERLAAGRLRGREGTPAPDDHVSCFLPMQAANALEAAGVSTFRQVCQMTGPELLAIHGVSDRTLDKIREVIDTVVSQIR